jgi:predicted Zn-dependent protease with MMP-like domain
VIEISDEQFDQTISEVMDELPKEYIEGLKNLAIVYEDAPSDAQREKLKLRCDQSLLGLYEGLSLNSRGTNYLATLPDKITLFKKPLLAHSASLPEFRAQVKHTLWHEIAHYYGLDHDRIHKLEGKQ